MKTLSRPALLSLLLTIVVTGAYAAKPRAGKHVAKPITVNIQAVVDSALIMADDYATAMAQKPEFAPTRLNILRNYYTALPTDAARDSVRSRIFDFYVNYVEEGKAEQADAFKSSFMSIAPDTDEHLGPLYANELTLARERFDTTAVKTNIDLLETYANRMNYDYDDDLASARQWLHTIRTRPNINDILPGVWVSERMAGYTDSAGNTYHLLPEKKWLINSLAVLRIRDSNSPVYDGMILNGKAKNDSVRLDAIKSNMNVRENWTTAWGDIYGYIPMEPWEMPAHNLAVPDGYDPTPIPESNYLLTAQDDEYISKTFITDNEAYGAFIFWGDERLKKPNAEIGAIIRQTTQNSQALFAGQLSRSKYDFGTRLLGNLTAGVASSVINSAVDALMVSTDKIWQISTVIKVINPYKLEATTYAQLIISKSNKSEPEIYEYRDNATYYRWECDDSIPSFWSAHYHDYYPHKNEGGLISLFKLNKADKEKHKDAEKTYSQKWEEWYKTKIKEFKVSIKNMSAEEKKQAKKRLSDLERKPRNAWLDYNRSCLERLKAKSDKYDQENL